MKIPSKMRIVLNSSLALIAGGTTFAPLAAQGAPAAHSAPATMPVSEIRPGMKGVGRTVFLGGKIDKFQFEVMGVQKVSAPGRSIIWIKASGGPLEHTGVMHGMSGSPCFIDGRLIGALSMGPEFSKDAIAGITPIGEMLEQLRDIPETPPSRTPLLLPRLEPPKVLKAALRGEMIPLSELLGPQGPGGAQPLPVLGAELCPEALSLWQGLPMRHLGLTTLAGSGSSANGEASPLEPGGMVSVNLMQGDLDFGAAGTITYASGRRLLLFGHPFFNLGEVDLPMWSATVIGNVPSLQSSSKMAFGVAPVGAVRLDRATGLAGLTGAEARLIPLRVGLNLGGKRNLNFRFDMADHPVITPLLAATALTQILNTHLRGVGFQSLALQGNVKLTGHPAIQMENMVADLNGNRLAMGLAGLLQALMLNPFEKPVVEGISITVKAEERLDLTGIAGVRVLKARARRGQPLPVLVTLQNIQGVRETATLNIHVPASARPGKAVLLVGDGMSLLATDPDERSIEVANLGDVVRILNNSLRNNHAYALLVQAQPGAGLRGSRIEGVPPTVSALLGSDGDSSDNRLQRRIVGRALLPLEREVRGLMSLDIEIE